MLNQLSKHKKIFGIFGLLVVICLFTAWQAPDSFLKAANIENTIRWTALFGIISVGVAFVIITGGIDLSIGSVVGLTGCLLAMALATQYVPQDMLQVREVDVSAKTLMVTGDATIYKAGDNVFYLEKIYEIESVNNDQIRVTEEIESGQSTGGLIRVHGVKSMTEEQAVAVRRGGSMMGLRSITLAGELPDLRAADRIDFFYEIGIPKQFTVHSVVVRDGQTIVDFYVRPNQRIRLPTTASISTRSQRMPTTFAILLVLGASLFIGLAHGLLITKVRLQPFVVTLCGLLFYRGLARYITGEDKQGFGTEYPDLKQLAKGDFLELLTGREFAFDLPMPFIYMTILAVIAAIFLNKTIFGRYILALGRNEQAARYSGINTDRMVIVSYVICSACAGLAGILFALDLNSIQPSGHGEFYELYAIAAAVLGGCSLRGGEGSILGVVIAAAVMRVLNNAINLVDGIDTSMEFAIIGMVILLGVMVDETIRRVAAKRRQASPS